MVSAELPQLVVPDGDAWRDWLDEHHESSTGVWLVLAKKGTTEPTCLTYDLALDEALCQGWIDGQVRRRDEGADAAGTYCIRFTPRRARSLWSARNVANVARLIGAGRMQPAGLDQVEQAKTDGRWDAAYGGPATMEVPADLESALVEAPGARAMFDILSSQNRYAIVYQISSAKRAETRVRRIEKYVAMLGRGETPYPQKRTLDT